MTILFFPTGESEPRLYPVMRVSTGALFDTIVRAPSSNAGNVTARGGLIVAPQFPLARRVAALKAAVLIEQSYWPEQLGSDRSPYDALQAQYEEAIAALVASVQDDQPNGIRFGSIPITTSTAA